jgi:hypothetical protein
LLQAAKVFGGKAVLAIPFGGDRGELGLRQGGKFPQQRFAASVKMMLYFCAA